MVPAHQGLETGYAIGLHIDNRLIEQHKFVAQHAHAHLLQQLHAALDIGAHFRLEQHHAVAPGIFGLVQGDVGVLQQLDRILALFEQGGANAGAHGEDPAIVLQRGAQQVEQGLDRIEQGLGRGDIAQDHGEFIAAQARDDVGLAEGAGQQAGQGAQQGVAGVMAVAVIDVLEVIDIDDDQANAAADMAGVLDHFVELALEQSPVAEAGQAVTEGQAFDLGLGFASLGDVLGHAQDGLRLALVVADQLLNISQPDLAAVVAHMAQLDLIGRAVADMAPPGLLDPVAILRCDKGDEAAGGPQFGHALDERAGDVHLAGLEVLFPDQGVVDLQRHLQAAVGSLHLQPVLDQGGDVAAKDHDAAELAVVVTPGGAFQPIHGRAAIDRDRNMRAQGARSAEGFAHQAGYFRGREQAGDGLAQHGLARHAGFGAPSVGRLDQTQIQVRQGDGEGAVMHQPDQGGRNAWTLSSRGNHLCYRAQ